jgi:ABC-type branched-subunit amino acid transport system substrate-binding protein
MDEAGVPLIIGPVLSPTAVVAASMASSREVVVLSPSATEDGIAELGSNVFQMNVTTGVLGRTIADYATNNLNIREFAILTPLSDYGRLLSESFKEEVERAGMKIVAEEFFDEGANDFRKQFLSLRQKLFALKQARDSLVAVQDGGEYHRRRRADSLCLADSALEIGGLFIPAECEDVLMIAPQVHFFKIRTQMLGATGWHTTKTILDGKRYVQNAVFATSAETQRGDSLWVAFRNAYKRRYNDEPDRVSALGYDAAALVCSMLVRLGADVGPTDLAEALRSVQGFQGASGRVSFDPRRGVNREAVVMKILDKRFIRVR